MPLLDEGISLDRNAALDIESKDIANIGANRISGRAAPTYNNDDSALVNARESIWKQFSESTVPRLKDLEAQMLGRTDKFILEATDSANKTTDMARRQGEISRESLGIQLTPEEQAGQDRLLKLGGGAAQISAQNQAVDVAKDINTNQANTLTSIQTGISNDALSNLTGASNLKDARESGDIANKSAADASNKQMAGTAVMLAAMMM